MKIYDYGEWTQCWLWDNNQKRRTRRRRHSNSNTVWYKGFIINHDQAFKYVLHFHHGVRK